jgi:D-inositol-3-phosphate glycosyltransferase
MKKLLFLATYPTQSNGYAKVGYKIANFLADYFEIFYFGFSNYNEDISGRKIDPRIKLIDAMSENKQAGSDDPFGVNIIGNYIENINPDIVMIYNDIVVTCRHLNVLNVYRYDKGYNFKVVNYIDLVYDYEKTLYMNHIKNHTDLIFAFSEHWKQNMINMGFDENKIKVAPHGLDIDIIREVDKSEARNFLNLNHDDFIILNANRNSYRKANDITISSFIKFLKMNKFNEKIKLFLHCDMDSKTGYNIEEIIRVESMKEKVDMDILMNTHIIRLKNYYISDYDINMLYNACDVGINTCIGEGFGLCNFEQASLGKPQVVSNVGGLKDIFKDYPEFTINPVTEYNITCMNDDHLGTVYLCRSEDFANRLSSFYNYYKKYSIIANKCKKYILENYDWSKILNGILLELNHLEQN